MDAPGLRLRESFRVAVTGRARLLVGAASATIDATVLDLSTTGMGLATAVATPKPPVGEVCAFELLIDGARIDGRGVVVWSRRARPDRGDAPNVGVRFERLEGFAQREIAALVDARLSTGRWLAEVPLPGPALEAGGTVAALPEQQLTLAVTTAPIVAPPRAAPPIVDPEPPPRPTPAAAPVAQIDALDQPAPSAKRRGMLWLVIATLVLLLAIVAVSLFRAEHPAEPVAPALDPVAPSELAASDVTATEASFEPTSGEGEAIVAEPAPIAAPASDEADMIAEQPAPVSADPPAATEARAAPAPPRAGRLLALEPSVEGSAEIITLRFDAPFREADLFAALIGPDPPRYLLRLRGIERQWRPADLEVGSPLVQRIRTGLHSTPRGPELHLVIDLNTRAIEHSWAIDGDSLRVRLAPRAP